MSLNNLLKIATRFKKSFRKLAINPIDESYYVIKSFTTPWVDQRYRHLPNDTKTLLFETIDQVKQWADNWIIKNNGIWIYPIDDNIDVIYGKTELVGRACTHKIINDNPRIGPKISIYKMSRHLSEPTGDKNLSQLGLRMYYIINTLKKEYENFTYYNNFNYNISARPTPTIGHMLSTWAPEIYTIVNNTHPKLSNNYINPLSKMQLKSLALLNDNKFLTIEDMAVGMDELEEKGYIKEQKPSQYW